MRGLIKKDTLKWILNKIHHRIPAMLILMVANIISAYIGVRFALVTKQLIDGATSGNLNMVLQACIILGIFIVTRIACTVLAIHLNNQLSADMDRDFKKDIFHTVLNSDFDAISKYHSGDLIMRMNGDASMVYSGILTLLSSATGLITSLVTAILLLIDMAPGFTIVLVCISVILAVFTLLIQRKMKELQKRGAAASGKVSGYIQESISRLLIVQALDVAPEVEYKADELLEERWQIQRERKNISILMSIGSSILAYVGSFAAMLWCVAQLLQGKMSFGSLTAMTQLASQLQGPMLTLPKLIPQFISITTAAERVMELEELPHQLESDPKDREKLYDSLQKICARDLTFSYDRKPVLKSTNFYIPKGGLTVIVGPSGIGKSTLLKLLLGIYHPSNGDLFIETKESDIKISRATRCLFSFAPQGNLLLSGTLRENLLLSNPDASEAELKEAIYVSAMDSYILQLPDGLDTPLRENAAGLSEGQAQRLSLARAVLSKAPILLLDEVTSSLDAETEKIVLERIQALPNRTCIVVTHRPAVLDIADWKLEITEDDVKLTSLKKVNK